MDHHALELADQIAIRALRLLLFGFELVEDLLDPVDRRQDDGDGLAGHRHAVAEFSHQRLSRVGERFEPGQSEEPAGSFDRVDKPEDVVEDLGVVRVLFEANELDVDGVEALVGLGQEFSQQIIHGNGLRRTGWAGRALPFGSGASVLAKGLSLVERTSRPGKFLWQPAN